MKKLCSLIAILGLVSCGDSAPPPKPAAPAPAPASQAPAPIAKAPEAKPEAVKPEPPRPDPNKELASRVKQALERDARVQAGEIDVTAQDGRVILWGTAATAEARTHAGQVAGRVQGVASVDNQLKVVKGS